MYIDYNRRQRARGVVMCQLNVGSHWELIALDLLYTMYLLYGFPFSLAERSYEARISCSKVGSDFRN